MSKFNIDDYKLYVETISGGKNTVIADDTGMPSVMYVLPKMYKDTLLVGGASEVHSAFVVDDAVKGKVAVSKFLNIVYNNRAYSLPRKDPRANINFDTAMTNCRNKGEGWCVTPFTLWAAIALWCKKNGFQPHGNNNYGRDVAATWEHGEVTYTYADGGVTRDGRTATGSGPATWYHDGTYSGIADLNGNVWEWNSGMRIVDGEIQVIPYSNVSKSTIDVSAASTDWRAIDADGNYIAVGSAGSLKMDRRSSHIVYTTGTKSETSTSGLGSTFISNTFDETVNDGAKLLLRELGILPELNDTDYGGDYFYYNLSGERLPIRGGSWGSGAYAGLFSSSFYYPRSSSHRYIGFRSAFYGDF